MTGLLQRRVLLIGGLVLALALAWLVTTDSQWVWPARSTLEYRALRWWWGASGPQRASAVGALVGSVRDATGTPIGGATVLLAEWDGTTHSAQSDAGGNYRIAGIPAGRYVPVAGAPGYASAALRSWGLAQAIAAGQDLQLDIRLDRLAAAATAPGRELVLGTPQQLSCTQPIISSAIRRTVSFSSAGSPNQPTFLYTPISGTVTLPTILAVYPGPADGWECASLPLAQAGYAVLAVGPAYSLDLEADIDEIERLLQFVRADSFPRADRQRIAVVAGSYSGLHVLRLLQRDSGIRAVLLLGPPTDIFDMRRRMEDRTFIPPYGLDGALVALGLPDRSPERYWRYSGAYHVDPAWPPLAVLHSRDDAVVPFQQSELLATKLTAAGVPHETLFFDGAQHYLLGDPKQIATVYSFTLDFLGRRLR